MPDDVLRLRCLVEGDSVFTLSVSVDTEIGHMKEFILEKGINIMEHPGILAEDLILSKVRR
jgi:hypothetical protein